MESKNRCSGRKGGINLIGAGTVDWASDRKRAQVTGRAVAPLKETGAKEEGWGIEWGWDLTRHPGKSSGRTVRRVVSQFSQRGVVSKARKEKSALSRATVRSAGLRVLNLRNCETPGQVISPLWCSEVLPPSIAIMTVLTVKSCLGIKGMVYVQYTAQSCKHP